MRNLKINSLKMIMREVINKKSCQNRIEVTLFTTSLLFLRFFCFLQLKDVISMNMIYSSCTIDLKELCNWPSPLSTHTKALIFISLWIMIGFERSNNPRQKKKKKKRKEEEGQCHSRGSLMWWIDRFRNMNMVSPMTFCMVAIPFLIGFSDFPLISVCPFD